MASFVFGSKLAARQCLRCTVRKFRTSVGSLAPIKVSEQRAQMTPPTHFAFLLFICSVYTLATGHVIPVTARREPDV